MARRAQVAVWCVCAVTAWLAFAFTQIPFAYAVTLTNNDSVTYKIEVIAKPAGIKQELAPGKSIKDICQQGCVIRLNGSADNEYELEGSERVSIEGGLVYYDGEELKNSKVGDQSQ